VKEVFRESRVVRIVEIGALGLGQFAAHESFYSQIYVRFGVARYTKFQIALVYGCYGIAPCLDRL
jgi:hypothetical protein